MASRNTKSTSPSPHHSHSSKNYLVSGPLVLRALSECWSSDRLQSECEWSIGISLDGLFHQCSEIPELIGASEPALHHDSVVRPFVSQRRNGAAVGAGDRVDLGTSALWRRPHFAPHFKNLAWQERSSWPIVTKMLCASLGFFCLNVGQLTCQVTKFVPCKFSLLAIHSLLVLRLFHSFSLTEGYNPKINWDSKFIRQSMKQGPCSSINAVRFFAWIYQWEDHKDRGMTYFIKDKNNWIN